MPSEDPPRSDPMDPDSSWTWRLSPAEPLHQMTARLYRLPNAPAVHRAVVRERFPAAFLDARMLTGNVMDLRIACCKALARQSRKAMLTKSLPMEVLYALSPRTGISDALKLLGFKAECEWLLVVWILPAASPSPADTASPTEAFRRLLAQEGGHEFPLEHLKAISNLPQIAQVYEFPLDLLDAAQQTQPWKHFFLSHVTSKIAIKE